LHTVQAMVVLGRTSVDLAIVVSFGLRVDRGSGSGT
jgi:hypothetical protein